MCPVSVVSSIWQSPFLILSILSSSFHLFFICELIHACVCVCVSIHQYADGRYWVYSPVLGRRKLNSSSSYSVSCHRRSWTLQKKSDHAGFYIYIYFFFSVKFSSLHLLKAHLASTIILVVNIDINLLFFSLHFFLFQSWRYFTSHPNRLSRFWPFICWSWTDKAFLMKPGMCVWIGSGL